MSRPLVPEDIHRNGTAGARSLVRAAIATAQRTLDGGVQPPDYLRRRWADDPRAALVLRAASSPAMTTTTGWAAEIAHAVVSFLGLLVPVSAGAELLGRGLQLRFDGVASISLPTISLGQAGFVGQGKPIRSSSTSPLPA
jgi:hypothetical protein